MAKPGFFRPSDALFRLWSYVHCRAPGRGGIIVPVDNAEFPGRLEDSPRLTKHDFRIINVKNVEQHDVINACRFQSGAFCHKIAMNGMDVLQPFLFCFFLRGRDCTELRDRAFWFFVVSLIMFLVLTFPFVYVFEIAVSSV